jgi:hypothetical protein
MIENIKQMLDRHKEEITKLQRTCKHMEHHRSRYMWAMGHFSNDVEICDWCGEIIETYNEMTPLDIKLKGDK